MQTRFNEGAARLSPDGRWMAYESNQSGAVAVSLTDYPPLKTTVQVSAGDGRLPEWSTDGRRLFYRARNRMMVVDVSVRGGLEVSTPRQWVPLWSSPDLLYDVMPNNEILLVDNWGVAGGTRELNVILNFFTELRQKAPAR
jgi:serine/threonine-protein kinase